MYVTKPRPYEAVVATTTSPMDPKFASTESVSIFILTLVTHFLLCHSDNNNNQVTSVFFFISFFDYGSWREISLAISCEILYIELRVAWGHRHFPINLGRIVISLSKHDLAIFVSRMDKSWLNIRNRVDQRYRDGVEGFLNWAFSQPEGFWDFCRVWDLHGEVLARVENSNVTHRDEVEDDSNEDEITKMIHDACGYINVENTTNSSEGNEESNMHATKFYKLLKDTETKLYPDCTKVSKLYFIVKLLHLKCLNHRSNKSMDELLSLFKEVLPEGSFVPISFYEAKRVLCDLGLGWKSHEHKGKKVAHKFIFHDDTLTPGPKPPDNDIDVYLQPIIEELKELWDGVETYDAHSKSNFLMCVALLWTINNFPAYRDLSG
ncbi:hypothetical protein RDI58_028338 [Solanum bulbocastanum]|uniref:Uncharacterized protein n=1 Tax=Solanum bulbocastanum TaxID=147425 RepID=A0AAN8SRR7_SOLBU